MRLPYELYLALRYLRFQRGRTFVSVITLISVAGVTVGTAALVIALSLMAGMVQDVRERIHSGSAHLTFLSGTELDLFDNADSLIERLNGVVGVQAASPVLYTPAMLSYPEGGGHAFAEIHGIEPKAHARVILDLPLEQTALADLHRPTESGRTGIVLGSELAQDLGVVPGDLVQAAVATVTLSPWGVMPRSRTFEVVGSYNSGHFQADSLRAFVPIAAARALNKSASGSSRVEVRLDHVEELESMKASLRDMFSPEWVVVDLIEQNQDLLKALKTEKLFLFLSIGLIVIVAALNIVSTLILMVQDKVKEIGTLSAMGSLPREVARIFVWQGGVIGLIGSSLGLMLGASTSWLLERYELIELNPDVYYLDHIPFRVQGSDLLWIWSVAMLISLLATLYPAFKAARLDPVDAIRYE